MDTKPSTEVIVLEVKNTTPDKQENVLIFPGPPDNTPDSPIVYMVHSHPCYSDQLLGLITEDREGNGFTRSELTGLSINDPAGKDWSRSWAPWQILARKGENLVQYTNLAGFTPVHSPYALRLGFSAIKRPFNIAFDEYFTLSMTELQAKSRLVFMLHLLHL